MKNSFPLLGLLLILAACGKSEEQKQVERAMEAGKRGPAGVNPGVDPSVEPVDFKRLQEALPAAPAGFKRSDLQGSKTAMGEMKFSHAQARYENEEGASLDIQILDYGSLKSSVAAASYAWTAMDINHETATGYTRTTTYNGRRGFEEYDSEGKSGQFWIVVGDRYIVNVDGNNLPMEQIKAAMDGVDLAKLAALR